MTNLYYCCITYPVLYAAYVTTTRSPSSWTSSPSNWTSSTSNWPTPYTTRSPNVSAPYDCHINRIYGYHITYPPVAVHGNMSVSQCDDYCIRTTTCLVTVHFVHNSTCVSYDALLDYSYVVPSTYNASVGLKNCSCKYNLFAPLCKKRKIDILAQGSFILTFDECFVKLGLVMIED